MREAPGFEGKEQRRSNASGRSGLVPETTVSYVEIGVRRNNAALPALLPVGLVGRTVLHRFQVMSVSMGEQELPAPTARTNQVDLGLAYSRCCVDATRSRIDASTTSPLAGKRRRHDGVDFANSLY